MAKLCGVSYPFVGLTFILSTWLGFCIQSLVYGDEEKIIYEATPYTVVKSLENGIEERIYPKKKWVTIEDQDESMEIRANERFMKLFTYIHGNNEKGQEIAMTVPVITKVVENVSLTNFEMGFYIPQQCQNDPPKPNPDPDSDIKIVEIGFRAFTITFDGLSKETDFKQKLGELQSFLKNKNIEFTQQKYLTKYCSSCSYKNPVHYFVSYDRPKKISKNEVWIPVD